MKAFLDFRCERPVLANAGSGHIRWRIENNGFKALDEQTNCDHVYTHDFHTFLALMLVMFIGWNLLLLFDLEGIRNGYEYVR
jgi:hypothetical protein